MQAIVTFYDISVLMKAQPNEKKRGFLSPMNSFFFKLETFTQ